MTDEKGTTPILYSPLEGLTCHDPLLRFGLRTGSRLRTNL